jgi:hypothetical protein
MGEWILGRFGYFALRHFSFLNPIKKTRAGFPVAPVVFIFYFQTSKLEGVNPPTFEVYISILISGLGGIDWFYPLDKILGKAAF